MELQAQSSLNLQVTKEDLIDILIDEQLSALEVQLEAKQKQSKELHERSSKLNAKCRKAVENRLMKFLPAGLDKTKCTVGYSYGYRNSNLAFNFPDYTVTVHGQFDASVKHTPAEEKEQKEIQEKLTPINQQIQELNNNIHQLNGNNKRIKAKMLKSFLTKTEEGKGILKVLGTTPKQALLGYGK